MSSPLFVLPELRSGVEAEQLVPLACVWALLLGWALWTDLFRNRTIKDLASLGTLFTAVAVFSLLYQDPVTHMIWALVWSVVFFLGWWLGAYADGDFKIFLAYAWLLGPAAFVVVLLSWVIILLYSIPTMIRSFNKKAKRGHRLGTAPGAPGIVLALPLGLFFLGLPAEYALLWTGAVLVMLPVSTFFAWIDKGLQKKSGA